MTCKALPLKATSTDSSTTDFLFQICSAPQQPHLKGICTHSVNAATQQGQNTFPDFEGSKLHFSSEPFMSMDLISHFN